MVPQVGFRKAQQHLRQGPLSTDWFADAAGDLCVNCAGTTQLRRHVQNGGHWAAP